MALPLLFVRTGYAAAADVRILDGDEALVEAVLLDEIVCQHHGASGRAHPTEA